MPIDDSDRLQPDMLLKCSRCGCWHAVRPHDGDVGQSAAANDMLFWVCEGKRFFAGSLGGRARLPIRRREVVSGRRGA
jgi:hypothetical protein